MNRRSKDDSQECEFSCWKLARLDHKITQPTKVLKHAIRSTRVNFARRDLRWVGFLRQIHRASYPSVEVFQNVSWSTRNWHAPTDGVFVCCDVRWCSNDRTLLRSSSFASFPPIEELHNVFWST